MSFKRYITSWSAAISIVTGQVPGRTITIDDRNVRVFDLVNPWRLKWGYLPRPRPLSPGDRQLGEELLECPGGAAEPARPAEAAKANRRGQMRLQRDVPAEAVVPQGGQGLPDLPVALAGGHDLPGRRQRVLHLQVDQVGPDQRVGLIVGTDPALHEVRRVERRPQH